MTCGTSVDGRNCALTRMPSQRERESKCPSVRAMEGISQVVMGRSERRRLPGSFEAWLSPDLQTEMSLVG